MLILSFRGEKISPAFCHFTSFGSNKAFEYLFEVNKWTLKRLTTRKSCFW